MTRMQFEPILAPNVAETSVMNELVKAMRTEQRIWRGMLLRTYHNWSAEKRPKWTFRIYRPGAALVLEYKTSSTPYVWVEAGTSWRRKVRMPRGYSPRTRPRVLSSRMNNPDTRRPAYIFPESVNRGIPARNFTHEVMRRRRDFFRRRIDRAFRLGVRNIFVGTGSRAARAFFPTFFGAE